jgi:hypothetical protein
MVTVNPIELLQLKGHPRKLEEGEPADISVLTIEEGDWTFVDTNKGTLKGSTKLSPFITFKNGKKTICDLGRGIKQENWSLRIIKDRLPRATAEFDDHDREFLDKFRNKIDDSPWGGLSIHSRFHELCRESETPLNIAARCIHKCFFEGGFTPQIGWFLANQDQKFVFRRLKEAANL